MRKDKKSLAETHPELAKQWHPTKNGDLTPNNLTPGSSKKVWWKCDKGDDHEWETSPKHRKNGTKCPVCSNRIIVKSNSLQFNYPQLAKEWHPTKNGVITPFKVSPGSNKKVWWKCHKGDDHEWLETINARIQGNGCTICSNRKVVSSNCLLTTHPEIAKQWHPTKNCGLTAKDVVIGSTKKVWWKCDKGDDHEWQAVLYSRINSGCPICTRQQSPT
jgi:DNA-directed RNA polymerase subunit RPC12/RpoP